MLRIPRGVRRNSFKLLMIIEIQMYLVPRGLLIFEFANTHKKFGLKFCICEFCFRGTKYRDASTANNKAYLYA